MDALEGLDKIAEQTSVCVNIRTKTKNRKGHWGLPPNFERAKVARENKKTPKAERKPATAKPVLPPPPAARLGRAIGDYRTLVETFRQRANELELSRAELDRLAGFSNGYSGQLLSPGKAKTPKHMGPMSLENMLATLGLKIVLIEDEAATAHTLARRVPVDHSQQRFGNVSRITEGSCLRSDVITSDADERPRRSARS
jgi:hypothetical protein